MKAALGFLYVALIFSFLLLLPTCTVRAEDSFAALVKRAFGVTLDPAYWDPAKLTSLEQELKAQLHVEQKSSKDSSLSVNSCEGGDEEASESCTPHAARGIPSQPPLPGKLWIRRCVAGSSAADWNEQPLWKQWEKVTETLMIPVEKYEAAFTKVLQIVLKRFESHFEELKQGNLQLDFITDKSNSAEAWCQSLTPQGDLESQLDKLPPPPWNPLRSVMTVNLAYPVSAVKLLQLVAHEAMHHVQNVALWVRRRLQDISWKEYAEKEGFDPKLSEVAKNRLNRRLPYNFYFEALAEFGVEILYGEDKAEILLQVLDEVGLLRGDCLGSDIAVDEALKMAISQYIIDVDRLKQELSWPNVLLAAKLFYETNTEASTIAKELREKALVPPWSWPSAEFIKTSGYYYVASYSWGKQLMHQEMTSRCKEEEEKRGTIDSEPSTCIWRQVVRMTRELDDVQLQSV